MENPSPRRTTRRADRYKERSGVMPSTELMTRTAPQEDEPDRISRVAAEEAPDRISHAQPDRTIPSRVAVPTYLAREDAQSPVMSGSTNRRASRVQRTTAEDEPRPTLPRQTEHTPPPAAMARPQNAPQRKKQRPVRKDGMRMPMWLTVSLVSALVVILVLFTAQSLMSAYLTRQEQAREAAYQRVVDAHPLDYRGFIEQYAAENNLQPAYVAAIILNESSFRKDAESGVGARGLMQLMPATAEWIAGKLDIADYSFDRMYDPETNIRFGTWYLGYLSNLFRGDPVLVTSAYHAGQGEVTGWLSDPSMSADGVTLQIENMKDGPTKTYAGRVTKAYGIYEALYYPTADGDGDDAVSVAELSAAR